MFTITNFGPEISNNIFRYIDYESLIGLEITCIYFRNVIRNSTFRNKIVTINSSKVLEKILSTHSFVSYKLCKKINNSDLKFLSEKMDEKGLTIKKLILDSCKITDEGLQYLNNCRKIKLLRCNITNKGLNILSENAKKCQKLILSCCENITDNGLQHLSLLKNLDLLLCPKIIGFGLKYLTSCTKLSLCGCTIIGKSLKYLPKSCTTLDLSYCEYITDDDLKYLGHCTKLKLTECNITDNGLMHLRNCKKLNLDNCNQITDRGLYFLENCEEVSLMNCKYISGGGLKLLTSRSIKFKIHYYFDPIINSNFSLESFKKWHFLE